MKNEVYSIVLVATCVVLIFGALCAALVFNAKVTRTAACLQKKEGSIECLVESEAGESTDET